MLYKFDYTISDAEYFEFSKFHYNSTGGKKKMADVYQGLVLIAGSLVSLLVLLPNYEDFDIWMIIRIIAIFIVLPAIILKIYFAFFFNADSVVKKIIEKQKKEGQLDFSKKQLRVEFEDEYFYSFDDEVEHKSKYSKICTVGDGIDGVYLYANKTMAYIIPNSAFENKEQRDEFVAFIKAKTAR